MPDCCCFVLLLLLLLQVADLHDAVGWLTNMHQPIRGNTPRDLPAGVLDPKV
jgi:hypothetical protein